MTLLKAYKNLDLRPNGVDALGRLTIPEDKSVLESFRSVYGADRIQIPLKRLDLALANSAGIDPWQVMIVIREKELPVAERSTNADKIVGFMIGHITSISDRSILKQFIPIRQSLALKPRIDANIDASPSVIIIDAFFNVSSYPIATMTAFLLRKLQTSRFGHCMTFLFWPSTKIDVKLGTQLVKFGYRPYGILDFHNIPDRVFTDGRCLAMWASRTMDSRELQHA
jgi:hypothetical protein